MQLYLDNGNGPAMVRVALDKTGGDAPRGSTATVTIRHVPDDCLHSTVVDAAWPDGTRVRVDVPTCRPAGGTRTEATRPALTVDQAVRVATDPRWGVTMDERLVRLAARAFPRQLPVFGR